MLTKQLQAGDVVLALAYSTATGATIAHCEIGDADGYPIKAVFVRKAPSAEYFQVSTFSAISQEWFALSTDEPLLFINEFKKTGAAKNWHRLVRVSLVSGEEQVVLQPDANCWSPGARCGWVTQLLSASGHGESLICVRAEEWAEGSERAKVAYEIVEFNVVRKRFTTLAKLEHIFY